MSPDFRSWILLGQAVGACGCGCGGSGCVGCNPAPAHVGAVPTKGPPTWMHPGGSPVLHPDCPPSDPLCSGSRWGGAHVSYPVATGGYVGFVSDGDIDAFNAAIESLTADVQRAVNARPTEVGLIGVQTDTIVLRAEWAQYVVDHTGTLSRFSDDTFAGFRLRYTNIRARLAALGGKLSAPDMGPGSNPGETGKPLVPGWVWPVGLGLIALVLLGPVVASVVARKAAGLP